MSATDRAADWRRATIVLLVAAAALLVVLVVTGAYLSTTYKPSVSQALDIPGLDDDVPPVRIVHRLVSTGFVLLSVALGVAAAGWAVVRRPRRQVVAPAAAVVPLVALAAAFSGHLLPWDQLALAVVTVDFGVDGVWVAAFDDRVRYVLMGSTEIDQSTYAFWTIVHVVLLPLLLAVAGGVLARLVTAARRTPDPGAGSPVAGDGAPTPDRPSTPAP